MPIRTQVHDLSHFNATRLRDVTAGSFFLFDGELARRCELYNRQCIALFSGPRELNLADFEPDRMPRANAEVLQLRTGLPLRIAPISAFFRRAQTTSTMGRLLLSQNVTGVGMSASEDAEHMRTPGRISVGLLGTVAELHEDEYFLSIEHWRADWLDQFGSSVISLISEPAQ